MFNSIVLDLVIGLVFTFLAVSLAVSAITEVIASITKWRSVTLRDGIKNLLNDANLTGIGKQIYDHALVNPRSDGQNNNGISWGRLPAYVDPKNFANALNDVLAITPGLSVAQIRAKIAAGLPNNPQIVSLLNGIVDREGADVGAIAAETAHWFDTAMDRVSGVYKRNTQIISFVVALTFAAVMNISTVHVAERLWQQPLDTALVSRIKAEDLKDDSDAGKLLRAQLANIGDLSGAVGWKDANTFQTFWSTELAHPTFETLSRIVGWLITAVAVLFGAPFWFDILQQFIRLKGAGPSPREKEQHKGASA